MTSAFRPVHQLAADDEVEFADHVLGSFIAWQQCHAGWRRRQILVRLTRRPPPPPRRRQRMSGQLMPAVSATRDTVRLQSALPAGGHSDACR